MSRAEPRPNWSRAMLRWLLLQHRIGPGARILLVGGLHEPLADRLTHFGLQLQALDERPERVLAARRESSETRVDHWPPGEPLPLTEDLRFDLILIRDRAELRRPAFSPRATLVAADLLSVLSPGGALVLADEESAAPRLLGHYPECLCRMLSGFPGTLARRRFPRSFWSPTAWRQLLTTGRRDGREFVSVEIPDRARTRAQWRRDALQIATRGECGCQTDAAAIPSKANQAA